MSDGNEAMLEQPAEPMSTDLARECEMAVSRMWVDLFGPQAGAEQGSFFQLGGDSAMAVKLVQRLAERFDLTLHVVNVFQYPTVRELAGFVYRCLSEQAAASDQVGGTQEILV